VYEVQISARPLQPFEPIVGEERLRALEREASVIGAVVGPHAIWNINSTAVGGGVAEMLRSLLRYARGLGANARWLVIEGSPEFFRITKRVHNALHGFRGDGSPLGADEASLYDSVTRENAVALEAWVRPGDFVVCHDPQTAGLIPRLLAKGARVAWRCHIGNEHQDHEVERGWAFLRGYLKNVPLAVFSRAVYAPDWLRGKRSIVLPPNIDPFSAKNQPLDDPTVRAILAQVGLVEGPPGRGAPTFVRDDGSIGRVDRAADVVRLGRAPVWDAPLVVQVSRWDTMKDPLGVLRGFAHWVEPGTPRNAQLVLAGPNARAIADDPEAAKVFGELEQAWRDLPDALRRSVHLAMLPMDDEEENAVIVNALQRHATVIVQKSLHEGFGLTVTEAMWKRRPVVASAVGGILDQIRDGFDGLLVHDPRNLREFADLLRLVLSDESLAQRLGEAGHKHVRDHYLSVAALERWGELLRVLAMHSVPAPAASR
jgi:trehalose synthase